MTPMPLDFKEWTVADLGQLPDDGLQYELLDGVLHVGAWPTIRHQVVRAELGRRLGEACPPDLYALATPVEWRPDPKTSLQPDVIVVAAEYLDTQQLSAPLALVAEVLSPSTRYRDLVLKHVKYASTGVPSYWVIDPEVPSMLAAELVDGRYRIVGEAEGRQRLELKRPFPVTLSPAELVSRHRPFSRV